MVESSGKMVSWSPCCNLVDSCVWYRVTQQLASYSEVKYIVAMHPDRIDHKLILRILERVNKSLVSTALVKLVYLSDYLYFQNFGRTITGYQYMWDHHGPNAVGHAIVTEARSLVGDSCVRMRESVNMYGSLTISFRAAKPPISVTLEPAMEMTVESIVSQYASLSLKRLVDATKQTKPFASISQYELIEMERSTPAIEGNDADWQRYLQDVRENGLVALQELNEAART